ncbi:putative flavanone 3-beta-hydroxylase [Arabidopsis thaliana]|uniref:Protein DMR6-LIKE OXYGENASE 2 n=1 Tax=Arabidopsis thaliana TaxID=3702 RepID=DLO2_ARATH|nr:2-oxoglutarate (2OG) and Fe(II)-dependent oxygenase superfamily protein [Arabidopsis thaliana]Q9ZSA7.1 RecName: Full=Protein DMR6-LIKE OXYGENASE 2; AltName: Full=2-oxoglutarate (2OG)-Fe(II) oxygenase-like protein DLO2; AltName: Full=Salicylate 3-hydroxylase DLO2; Short=S3H DLO2; Short=SA 3-hydroxylase DLO2; Short=Salicylic acid 3-hydroxylase DLO2 [Arabidopsis thaliana]AAD03424.1 contains similarity to Iron/Ascorbate family of oxidoreductases (Pfam: PF00671, Score=307.1, E=2.2e-88, N=1) [Arabid|eukprot:NP_192787.1 2-oxoglutarate (2OG) and Fe(II)-dependent oxygenase superfamily protein [Arabidopsis thaliana]
MAASKLLVSDIASVVDHVPSNYVRPVSDRPKMSEVQTSGDSIPLIDLHDLHGPNRADIINQFAHACSSCGFFQIKNHGVPEETIKKMMNAAREFFRQSESERVKHYSADTKKTTRLSTSFNVSKEKVSNWRDFLRLHCYPIEDFINEWPSTPISFREVTAEYATSVRALVLTLLEAISESLGLAKDRVSNTIGKHGQHMAINYYPRCPQPELTYGLPGHKDANLITVLLQDEVSGLQVFKDGKWIAVNPVPNTFIVNLGDQMQVISNEKYKSVLHRAVVNSDMERISIPTFYCPSEDAVISPAQELINEEEDSPAIYRNFTYAEYFEKFWDTAFDTESCIDSFKASTA